MKPFARLFLPFAAATLMLSGCGYAGPEKAVRKELDLIQQLDEPTIKSFVSYEDIQLSSSEPLEINEETTEAVRLFFQDFRYHIDASSQSADETAAEVQLSITNLDSQLLAKDLCREMYRASLKYNDTSADTKGLNSSFALMRKCLTDHEYPKKTISTSVQLTKQNGVWCIQESPEFEDALVGGLVSYLSDPYLLQPEEVLDLTLEPFRDFTAQQWASYLDFSDLFPQDSELSASLDDLVCEKLADYFDYEIIESVQDQDQAEVTVNITSFDLNSAVEQCLDPLIAYAKTTASIRASEEEIAQKTAEILLNALKTNTDSITIPVKITLHNDGHTWDAALDEEFTAALLGDLTSSLESLNAAAHPDAEAD